MLRELLRRDTETGLNLTVKTVLLIAFWIPVLMVLWGVGIAIIRTALYVDPARIIDAMPVDSTTGFLVGAIVIGYLYLVVANETFGRESVETAQEQAESFREEIDD